MFFWNSLVFSMIQRMLAIWSQVPLPFLYAGCISGSSWFTYCWSILWRIFEYYFASMWNECSCVVVWTFFGIAFLWDLRKTDLFQVCGHCWVFQICWHIQWSTITASSFRVWNSSAGMPSLPLALFITSTSFVCSFCY